MLTKILSLSKKVARCSNFRVKIFIKSMTIKIKFHILHLYLLKVLLENKDHNKHLKVKGMIKLKQILEITITIIKCKIATNSIMKESALRKVN